MRARPAFVTVLPLLAILAGCGTVPVADAEASCLRDAELALRPRGEARIGLGTDSNGNLRPVGRLDVEISSGYLAGRDPSDVYNRCVLRRSGQMPTRALYDQPGWRG